MDRYKEEKFAKRATATTVALAFAGIAGGGVYTSYAMFGDELEGAETDFSQKVSQNFEDDFSEVVALRDGLKNLERDRALAYQSGNDDMIKAIESEIEAGVDTFDDARSDLLTKAVTNSFLSERDYKDLLENFNAQGISTGIDYTYFDADEAEYLNVCRLKASDNGVPLRADIGDVYEVTSCMSHKEENFFLGMTLFPFMGVFFTAMFGMMGTLLRDDFLEFGPIDRGYRKLYRKFNTKLGQN